jgi:hypothetical protein
MNFRSEGFALFAFCFVIMAEARIASTQAAQTFSELVALHQADGGEAPVKCATDMMLNLREKARAAKTASGLTRPILPASFPTADGRFRIHYTTSGDQAVDPTSTNAFGVPDYVYETALAATRSYHLLIDSLGYRAPASDNGTDGQEFDMFIQNLGAGVYGYTDPESPVPGMDGRYSAYCVIDNDFVESGYITHGVDALRITVAHEYFHAVQMNYYLRTEDSFFLETSSVWFEDVAYDAVDDYLGYLPRYFRSLQLPFYISNRSHEYGNGIWLHYLTKRFDVRLVRQVWEKMETTPALLANHLALAERGYTFGDAFSEYGLWLHFTGYRADPARYFPEGARYPLASFSRREQVEAAVAIIDSLQNLSFRFYQFVSPVSELTVSQGSPQPGRWIFASIGGNPTQGYQLNKSAGGRSLGVSLTPLSDTLVVIVSNTSMPTSSFAPFFSYSLRVADGRFRNRAEVLFPRPNPFIPTLGEFLILPIYLQEAAEVELLIVREDGHAVRHLNLGLRDLGINEISWDGRDEKGEMVGSGVYLIEVVANEFHATAKVAVVRQ